MLKSVLHDWDDLRCVSLLRRCREAMHKSSRLLLLEFIAPPAGSGTTPEHRRASFADLHMLVATGGAERTIDEWSALLDTAGLRLAATVPTTTPPPYSFIEARLP